MKNNRFVMRLTFSTVLGLLIAVAAVAGGPTPVNPDPGGPGGTPNCFQPTQQPPFGLIIKAFCKSSCTLDTGCCQADVIRTTHADGSYTDTEYRYCNGSAYSCTTSNDPNRSECRNARGVPAFPIIVGSD